MLNETRRKRELKIRNMQRKSFKYETDVNNGS